MTNLSNNIKYYHKSCSLHYLPLQTNMTNLSKNIKYYHKSQSLHHDRSIVQITKRHMSTILKCKQCISSRIHQGKVAQTDNTPLKTHEIMIVSICII